MSQTERILSTILLRDAYREARLHYVMRLVLGTLVLLAFSLAGNVALLGKGEQYRYVLLDDSRRVMELVPLHLPKHPDEFVVKWAIEATTKAYTFDFRNYHHQLQEARSNLTAFGWRAYQEALEDSGNFTAILANKYVTTAEATGPGRIIKKGHFGSRHAWRIQFPMRVTYQSSRHVTRQDLTVTVVVIRQPEFVQPDGLGLRSIIAE